MTPDHDAWLFTGWTEDQPDPDEQAKDDRLRAEYEDWLDATKD